MRLCFLLELVPLRSEKIKSHATKTGSWYLLRLLGVLFKIRTSNLVLSILESPPLVSLTSMLYPFLEISTHTKKVLLKPETKILSLCYSGCFFLFRGEVAIKAAIVTNEKKAPQSTSFDQTVLDYSGHGVHSMYS